MSLKSTKLLRRATGLFFIFVFFYFVYRAFILNINQVNIKVFSPDIYTLMFALSAYLFWLCLFELSWEWLLRKICIDDLKLSWTKTSLAFIKSVLSRYIPGKVWYLATRSEILVKQGISRQNVLRSVLYEQAHFFFATVTFTLILLPIFLSSLGNQVRPALVYVLTILIITCVAIWLFYPERLFTLSNKILAAFLPESLRMPLFLKGHLLQWQFAFALFFAVVVVQALTTYPIIKSVLSDSSILKPLDWIMVMGAYPVARLIGQLGVVSPGGIGVREGAYVMLILPVLDGGTGSIIAVWMRLVSIVSEALMFAIFFVLNLLIKNSKCMNDFKN